MFKKKARKNKKICIKQFAYTNPDTVINDGEVNYCYSTNGFPCSREEVGFAIMNQIATEVKLGDGFVLSDEAFDLLHEFYPQALWLIKDMSKTLIKQEKDGCSVYLIPKQEGYA